MECPSGVVFAIKANQQDFMLFGRHGSREIGIEKEQQIEQETEEKKKLEQEQDRERDKKKQTRFLDFNLG